MDDKVRASGLKDVINGNGAPEDCVVLGRSRRIELVEVGAPLADFSNPDAVETIVALALVGDGELRGPDALGVMAVDGTE